MNRTSSAVSILVNSPIGTLTVTECEERLTGISFGILADNLLEGNRASPLLDEARSQLEAYFSGRLQRFDLPIAFSASAFRESVWHELASIPYGEVRSYGQIASAIARPSACRAVGGAVHHNPIVIVIPCHRVIGADGSLTGFGGGLPIKSWLLANERTHK